MPPHALLVGKGMHRLELRLTAHQRHALECLLLEPCPEWFSEAAAASNAGGPCVLAFDFGGTLELSGAQIGSEP